MSQLPPTLIEDTTARPGKAQYRRIATEEAFCPVEMLNIYRQLLNSNSLDDPGFNTMFRFYLESPSARARYIIDSLADLGDRRLAAMDEAGIDTQVISLTSPGVQVMPKEVACPFSITANDMLAEACKAHPSRFVGLAACAPQDPTHAAKEIERATSQLGLKGVIINSHTMGEYLDDPKFWDIFAAAEAADVPIYLHPFTPSPRMLMPLLERGLDGAIYGFSVETGMHMLRIIIAGVFDRFPALKLVIGHVGESLPFTLYRLDYMHRAGVVSKRYESMKPLKRKISDYFRHNIWVTNSGVAWEPSIKFCQQVLGVDRVMYAMDYPYQFEPSEVARLDEMDMDLPILRAFFQENAEKLFKI
ncbi:MAG: amidohydrolase family protein [Sphingomonas sp.]